MADKQFRIQIDTASNTAGANQAEKAMDGVAASAQRAGTSQTALSSSTNSASGSFQAALPKIQQASYQVQDFAVQVTGGVDATKAFAQQAPQFLGAFGPWGAVLGGAIALMPLFIKLLGGSKDESKEAAEALEKHKEAVADFAEAWKGLAVSYADTNRSSQQRLDDLKQELALIDRLNAAEADRAKRQARADGETAIAIERIRLAGIEAQLTTAAGETAVRLGKEREAILQRIADKEREIAEALRKAAEAEAQKKVDSKTSVVTGAQGDLDRGINERNQRERELDENTAALEEERQRRQQLIATLEEELAEAKRAQTDRGLARQRVLDGKLGAEDLEKQLAEAKKPTLLEEELAGKAKTLRDNYFKAAEAVKEFAERVKAAEGELKTAQADQSGVQAGNDQARSIESTSREVTDIGAEQQKILDKKREAEQAAGGQLTDAMNEVIAAIPNAKDDPAVVARQQQLEAMLKDGLQSGEKDAAFEAFKELQSKVSADNAKRGQLWNGVVALLDASLSQIDSQQRQLDALSQRLEAIGSRQSTAGPVR